LILALAVAWLLRLNKGIARIASNISIPPMIPILLFMSYETGGLVLGRRDIDRLVKQNTILHAIYNWMSHAINSFHIRNAQLADEIAKNVTQYIVGSFALATLSAVLSGFATYLLVKTLKKN
jgi:uncharacterized protein (DUF2062 family)